MVQFQGQDWVITPVAPAVSITKPDERWEVVLSGVAEIDFKSTNPNDWTGQSVTVLPDMDGPLQHAVYQFNIPVPTNPPYVVHTYPDGIRPVLQVEQMSAYAALGSIFYKNTAVNAGFSVNTWRPNHYMTLASPTAPTIGNIFTGIVVDVAVRAIDACLYRINYHITIIGKMVFVRYQGN